MSSIDDSHKNSQLTQSSQVKKIKAMAVKYQKYLNKHTPGGKDKPKTQCLKNWTSMLFTSAATAWHFFAPKIIRGPVTPYQVLEESFPSSQKQPIKNISFSKLSISQSIQTGHITLLLTLMPSQICYTLEKLSNHQQFNLLIRNKAQIIPLYYQKNHPACSLTTKVDELLLSRSPQYELSSQQFILVCWKGLFNEILILDFISLDDENLCSKVLSTLDQRQLYEDEVKNYALSDSTATMQGFNKVRSMEKSTSLTKSSSAAQY